MAALRGVLRRLFAGGKKGHRPQLVMWYRRGQPPSLAPLAGQYRLRAYRPGDEEGWLALLAANGELGTWDRERLERQIQGGLLPETQFFAVLGEELVAAAGAYERCWEGRACREIGWVATHPEHRGRGLGGLVTAAAMRAALERDDRPLFLRTDDFRTAAIRLYLRLGFEPDMEHPSYPERWRALGIGQGVQEGRST